MSNEKVGDSVRGIIYNTLIKSRLSARVRQSDLNETATLIADRLSWNPVYEDRLGDAPVQCPMTPVEQEALEASLVYAKLLDVIVSGAAESWHDDAKRWVAAMQALSSERNPNPWVPAPGLVTAIIRPDGKIDGISLHLNALKPVQLQLVRDWILENRNGAS